MNNKHHPGFFLEGFLRTPASGLTGVILAVGILFGVSLPAVDARATALMPRPNSQAPDFLPNTIFLPLILNGQSTQPSPILVAPQNGAVLDTLIPLFQWDMSAQPAKTSSCLAFSTSPHPTDCQASGFASSGPHEVIAWSNLSAGTQYHWRVAAYYAGEHDHPNWSEERSFTTGPAGGTILPSPILISPENGSSVAPNNPVPTLRWNAVAGAVAYSISLHDIDRGYWYGMDETTTQLTLSWPTLEPLTHYDWYVEARNGYAWGTSSATWQFITTSGSASRTSSGSKVNVTRLNLEGTLINVIR